MEQSGCGCLYGIGVGPGDPELMTVKAIRVIRRCGVIFAPGKGETESVAYGIALKAVPELGEKPRRFVDIPMVHDRAAVEKAYDEAADQVEVFLRQGEDVGFLNLGDVTLYATYLHIHRRLLARGCRAELINGIPSFCAAAAAFHTGLAEGHEQLHILSKPGQAAEGILLPGTKVVMKSGRGMKDVAEAVKKSGQQVFLAENVGMDGERLACGPEAMTGQEGYYTLLIVKDKKEDED
ncbi:MAG: precorrin-2 C(20)-methyltransferase [Eubacteriales bacterium]|nr:precorrin-2 C(20)-methyltransferase [Eubacteriales bacterium]